MTCTQGATATATATTTAHEPVLNIACVTPDRQYMGRSFEVAFIATNSGDAAAAGSTLVITIPAGLAVSASGNGQVKEGSITYDLGSIDATAHEGSAPLW